MRLVLLAFLFFSTWQTIGQESVNFTFNNDSYQQLKKNPKTKFNTFKEGSDYLKSLISSGQKKGYLICSIDSIVALDSSNFMIYFFLGPLFKEGKLSIDQEETSFLRRNGGLKESIIIEAPVSPRAFQHHLKVIHNTYLDNGFPFAAIELIDVQIDSNTYSAHLEVDRGPLVKWNKIHIRGDSSISEVYASNLIGIRKGQVYNESEVRLISTRLKQVNFIKEIKPSEILFTEDGAELFMYLKSNPISAVNGILGLQRNNETDKVIFTGELNLKLVNVLKRGEMLDIKWRSLKPQSQSLNTSLNIPFLFKTPFGVDGKFNLYKQDTSFLELISTVGVQYFLKGGNYIKGYYQNNTSSLLSGSISSASPTKQASVSSNNYGLSLFRRQLDYIPNPSSGIQLLIEGSAGIRSSKENDSSEVIKNTIYRGRIEFNYFLPIIKRHVIRLANNSSYYYAPTIYANELIRFGGLNEQRGFNEEALFASAKTTFSIEYRYLLDRNSHVFLFYDQSWYENTSSKLITDTPYGFGAGFSFGTNLGIFSISYALGKQFDNPILLRDGKIHFGYIAYF